MSKGKGWDSLKDRPDWYIEALRLYEEASIGGFSVSLDEPLRDLDERDRFSNECAGCGKRWVLAMDDSGICPMCFTVNPATDPEGALPALEYLNRDGSDL